MLNVNPGLGDFLDSPYANELARGTANLRFAEPLETEYTTAYLRWARVRIRIWLALMLALCTIVPILRQLASFSLRFALLQAIHFLLVAGLVWLAWSPSYERAYLPYARLAYPVVNSFVAAFTALAYVSRHAGEMAGFAVHLMATFFFTGLKFHQALASAAAIMGAFVVTASAAGLPFEVLMQCMLPMSVTSILGVVVCLESERSHRKNFLESALIGELVMRDGLSGLMNRRAFDEHLGRVWQHALRDQRSLAILMIDIDHFKKYNDEFGHQGGDAALRSVAQTVQGFTRRPLDIAARYGGEEFAAILYDLAPHHVMDIAQRLRESVQKLEVRPPDPDRAAAAANVTVSVGVAIVTPAIGRTPEGAVQLADEALYEAKAAGRNRVVLKGVEAYQALATGSFKTPLLFQGTKR